RRGGPRDRAYLSSSPFRSQPPTEPSNDLGALLRGAAILGLTLPVSFARRLLAIGDPDPQRMEAGMMGSLKDLQDGLKKLVVSDSATRRSFDLVEIITANIIGIIGDGLLQAPDAFRSIDHLDYREWLARHGVDPAALDSPLLRGMYDLTFAYEDADTDRPRFSAGLGLQLATRMLFAYSGGVFWKMRAGMGEVIFAALYQVLRRRGVDFRFFHRVDALHVSAGGRSIESIDVGIQAETASGEGAYAPLTEIGGIPCWPAAPLAGQLLRPELVEGRDLESFWCPRTDHRTVTLRAGEDFDQIVFAISAGMVPHLCAELVEASPEWRAMASNLGTVATQSLQLWLNVDEKELGWRGNPGDVISGFTEPFDTWASMSHLVEYENWPADAQPRSIAYFCSPLDTRARSVELASQTVATHAREFLDRDVKALWPGCIGPEGFRWDLLCDPSPESGRIADAAASERLNSQYWRANVDPSDLYVQSLPGTDRYRLAPGETGFDNLAVAGDWTDCGLNAGCIEAATISGQLAAKAVIKRSGSG
ncbi:MAG TPA: FAD-dependent oxidoreductase, partial [Acidimicrobiales bacterium]|nr:FAD-dependent oxidoreductase [Acidimicrobiales bacterium]